MSDEWLRSIREHSSILGCKYFNRETVVQLLDYVDKLRADPAVDRQGRLAEIAARLEGWRANAAEPDGDPDVVAIFELHAPDDIAWLLANRNAPKLALTALVERWEARIREHNSARFQWSEQRIHEASVHVLQRCAAELREQLEAK